MLERGDGVGGTWHYNTYPGCACDVPSNLYSFSFAPNPDWSRTYSRQPEIRAYLERVVDELRRATEDPAEHARCSRPHGMTRPSAGVLDTSQGEFTREGPRLRHRPAGRAEDPGLPGPRELRRARRSTPRAGTTTSTCAGKRVASIGTGASAIQYVPQIAPDVEQLYVFQRTPPWVMPHSARPVKPIEQRALPALPGRPARGARRHLRRARADGARLRQAAARDEAARDGRRAGTASASLAATRS